MCVFEEETFICKKNINNLLEFLFRNKNSGRETFRDI